MAINEDSLNGRLTGNSPNSAQTEIGASIAGGITDIASTSIGAGLQYNEISKAKEEGRVLSEQNREDALKQNRINYNFQNKIRDNEERMFNLKKLEDNETLRHNTWLYQFEKALSDNKNLVDSTKKIFSNSKNAEVIKNILLEAYRKK